MDSEICPGLNVRGFYFALLRDAVMGTKIQREAESNELETNVDQSGVGRA